MVEQLENIFNFSEHLQRQLLLAKFPYVFSTFTADCLHIGRYQPDGTFFEILHPAPYIVDIVMGKPNNLSEEHALALAVAIKFEVLRFAMPMSKGYYYDKVSLWDTNILSPQDILEHIYDFFSDIFVDLHATVSLFYGRIHLERHTLTYVNYGFNNFFHYSDETKMAKALGKPSFPLGVIGKRPDFSTMRFPIRPGDCFVFSSNPQGMNTESVDQQIIESLQSQGELNAYEISDCLNEIIKKSSIDQENPLLKSFLFIVKLNKRESRFINCSVAKFLSNFEQLESVRLFVKSICNHCPGDTERLSIQLQLAINELFCNIVKHSYGNQVKGEILIECQSDDEGIYITLSDKGKVFNPIEIKHPNLAGDQENGFGLFIVQQIADYISYTPRAIEEGWNHLSIFKRYFFEEDRMEFSHQMHPDNILVITPKGENLDAKNAVSFKEGVLELIRTNGSSKLIFDLSHLQFIDSSGLGTFLSIQRFLTTQGGTLKLANLNKSIRTMFEIVSMHRIFDIFPTVEEALQSY